MEQAKIDVEGSEVSVAVAVPVESAIKVGEDDGSTFGIFNGRNKIFLKQRFEAGEAIAQQLCACAEWANKYDIYDGETGEPLLFVQEESDMFERGCCAPHHNARLRFFDVRGVPLGSPLDESRVLMNGIKPFKLPCFSCADICRKSITGQTPDGQIFTESKMPAFAAYGGDGFTPKVEMMIRGEDGTIKEGQTPLYVSRGPTCCVGGLIELCSEINFPLFDQNGQPAGLIQKLKPNQLGTGLAELVSDQDAFMMDLPPNATNEEKAALVMQMLLMDYTFFEGGSLIKYNFDGSCDVTCCQCFCYGCLCTCKSKVGGNQNSG